jgi:hypothetical protein
MTTDSGTADTREAAHEALTAVAAAVAQTETPQPIATRRGFPSVRTNCLSRAKDSGAFLHLTPKLRISIRLDGVRLEIVGV